LRDKTKVLHEQTRYTTFPQTPQTHSLSPSAPRLCHLSVFCVSYSLSVGTVGYNLCRHQEQIISAKPAPYFGVFNFQIVLPDVSSVGQAPPTIYGDEDCSLFLWHPELWWMPQLFFFFFFIKYQLSACSTRTSAYPLRIRTMFPKVRYIRCFSSSWWNRNCVLERVVSIRSKHVLNCHLWSVSWSKAKNDSEE